MIQLERHECICARHGELFKVRWPSGYEKFTELSYEALLCQKPFADEFNREKLSDSEADQNKAMHKLLNKRPMCCRIEPKELAEVYKQTNALTNTWEVKRCDLCTARRAGAKFRRVAPGGMLDPTVKPWSHVCIGCVCKR